MSFNEHKQRNDADPPLGDQADDHLLEALDSAMAMVFGSAADNLDSADNLEPSETVGRYKLLEKIGEGGFGVVYMAEQRAPISRRVALKIIKLGMDTKQVVARFEAERQALAMMDHENIASVYDAGATETGRPYFVMELVRGTTITEFCDRNKLSVPERLELFVAVCRAVQHAHQKGIIHRDLKPSNVMVTLRDGTPIPKVIDFGVAKATQGKLTEKTVFTRYGQFIGTPAYMSPEQVEMSEVDVDTRSDIFSLGVLLYELLTGSTPIDQEELNRVGYSEMQQMICEQEPPKPSTRLSRAGAAQVSISAQRSTEPKQLGHYLRGELDWIVMRALEKDRARRYETAIGLARDVVRHLNNEPVEATPASAGYLLSKFAWKHRGSLVAVGAFTILLLASTVVSAWLAIRATKAEGKAIEKEALARERLGEETKAKHEMERQRDLAKRLGVQLHDQLAETNRIAQHSRRLLYVSHMNLIQRELDIGGNDPRVIDLLKLHRPRGDQHDLRGFEWYYFWGHCHRHPWRWRYPVAVTSADYSPDGRYVAIGRADGRIEIRDSQSGQIVSQRKRHDSNVTGLAFALDGKTLYSASLDGSARRWVFDNPRFDSTESAIETPGMFHSLQLSPNGQLLALGGHFEGGGSLNLWDLETEELIRIDNDRKPVWSVSFSHDSTKLASASNTPAIDIVDVEAATITEVIETDLGGVTALKYSPVADLLAIGDSNGMVQVYGDQTIGRLGSHSEQVSDLEFSRDGSKLASAAHDYLIFLWDVQRQAKTDVLRGHVSSVFDSIAFSPDGNSLASTSKDHSVLLWDLTRDPSRLELPGDGSPITAIAFSPQQNSILTSAARDGTVKLWEPPYTTPANTLPHYEAETRCLSFSPDGRLIAYAGGDDDKPAGVFIWDRESRSIRRSNAEHQRRVVSLAFAADGRKLATGDDQGILIVWDTNTAAALQRVDNNSEAILSTAFSPDGKWLSTCSFHSNQIVLRNADDLAIKRLLSGHQGYPVSVAFSPDSKLLASGSVDNTVRVWDIESGNEILTFQGHGTRVTSVAFSPGGDTLASIGQDGNLRLWDVATGQEKATFPCDPEASGNCLSFSADGRSIAVSAGDSVVLYRAATDQDLFANDPPETPKNHGPHANETIDSDPIRLEAVPFFHRHSEVGHRSSHWQMRTADGSYSTPVVNLSSTSQLGFLDLERGIVMPNTTYYWRVAFTSSNHATTDYSQETAFKTPRFNMQVVPFDLSPHFNRDIVVNPGDEDNDSLDYSLGSHLFIDGYDGKRTDNPQVNGLPLDQRLGVHVLADYSHENAIQAGLNDTDKTPVRIGITLGHYRFVKFLVVGGNGNSDMPLRLEYGEGEPQREVIVCDDWFHDHAPNRYGILREGLLPVVNEMDRFYKGEFQDNNAAAVFEFTVRTDSSRTLQALVLETDSDQVQFTDTALWPDHRRARFNLLAATGLVVE